MGVRKWIKIPLAMLYAGDGVVSPEAWCALVKAWLFTAQTGQDGRFTPEAVLATAGIAQDCWRRVTGELAKAGLWEQDQSGAWLVAEFLEWNTSQAAYDARVERLRDAGSKGGKATPSSKMLKHNAKHNAWQEADDASKMLKHYAQAKCSSIMLGEDAPTCEESIMLKHNACAAVNSSSFKLKQLKELKEEEEEARAGEKDPWQPAADADPWTLPPQPAAPPATPAGFNTQALLAALYPPQQIQTLNTELAGFNTEGDPMATQKTARAILETIHQQKPVTTLAPSPENVKSWAKMLLPAIKPQRGIEAAREWMQFHSGYPTPADINTAWERLGMRQPPASIGHWEDIDFPWCIQACITNSPTAYTMVEKLWAKARRIGAKRAVAVYVVIGKIYEHATTIGFPDFGTSGHYTPQLQRDLARLTSEYPRDWPPPAVLEPYLKPEYETELSESEKIA
ncbi:hypothetical protein HHJ78_10955 [Mobiluncus mulieris]|uniref:Uncharacterized protein n=1 Tax=Mobiluncus mulieris TaxID=2052 RepID=A0A7Y0Y528_9ACTO|nr:hypothetical protein [Mobiluncus mulieris]NMW66003.1 hypothetical protein [Mobiluncus mulieris]